MPQVMQSGASDDLPVMTSRSSAEECASRGAGAEPIGVASAAGAGD